VRVLIRTTLGVETGFGHLRRCLSLAAALRSEGVDPFFAIDGPATSAEYATAHGFEAKHVHDETGSAAETAGLASRLGATVIVADSYAFDSGFLRDLGKCGAAVAVLDDAPNQELPVDLVVNPTPGIAAINYADRTSARLLLGPAYALLREEFQHVGRRQRGSRVDHVLLTIGGSDPRRLTERLIHWTRQALPNAALDVILGPVSSGIVDSEPDELTTLHHGPSSMVHLMSAADMAISGGGQTTYELAACGVPTIAIRIADNQTANLTGLQNAGSLVGVGDARDPDLQTSLQSEIVRLARDETRRRAMSAAGQALVDGRGASRVAREIVTLRRAA